MSALIVSLLAQLSTVLSWLPQSTPPPGCPDRAAPPFSFATSGARSNFVLSSDGARILFEEKGKLRAVSVADGSISTLRALPPQVDHIAAIPGRPATLLLAARLGDVHSPSRIWLAPLSGSEDIAVDVGDHGSDGALLVSDSGRYLATGTDFVRYGDRDGFAQSYSVFSTSTGARLFSTPIPKVESVQPDPSGQGTELRTSSQLSRAVWAKDDVLLLEFYEGPAKAFAQGPSGSWGLSRVPSAVPHRFQPEHVYGPTTTLVTGAGVSLGTAVLSCLFGPELGVVEILRGLDEVVLLKTSPPNRPDTAFRVVFYLFR